VRRPRLSETGARCPPPRAASGSSTSPRSTGRVHGDPGGSGPRDRNGGRGPGPADGEPSCSSSVGVPLQARVATASSHHPPVGDGSHTARPAVGVSRRRARSVRPPCHLVAQVRTPRRQWSARLRRSPSAAQGDPRGLQPSPGVLGAPPGIRRRRRWGPAGPKAAAGPHSRGWARSSSPPGRSAHASSPCREHERSGRRRPPHGSTTTVRPRAMVRHRTGPGPPPRFRHALICR
jgi:hypothetical protein